LRILKPQHQHIATTIVVLGIACFFLFFQLGKQSVLCSDESLYATNAVEMMESGDLVTLTFQGKPDHYNCKPPLAVIGTAASMKLFGKNEWGLRFPSALAALGTMLLLLWFSRRWLKNPVIGYVAILILASSSGYVGTHITRTGDPDALLIFWVTLYSLAFFGFLHSDQNRSKNNYLAVTATGIAFAFLTKGIVGFIPVPALVIYALYVRKLKTILLLKRVWIAITAVLFCCLGYLLIRETNDPGYLTALGEVEWGGRFSSTVGGHQQPFHFYVYNLFTERFFPWVLLLIPAFVIGVWKGNKVQQNVLWLLFILCAFVGLIFSIAQTKLYWYDGPLYPFMSLALAIGLVTAYHHFIEKALWQKSLVLLLFLACFTFAGKTVYHNITTPVYTSVDKDGRLLYAFRSAKPEYKNFTYFKQVEDKQLLRVATFYAQAWKDDGYQIKVITDSDDFSNRLVLTPHWHVATWLREKYGAEKIFECKFGVAMKVENHVPQL
jgi:4-amino-4-deoxy-L-arabinose transferase-like glycosyltransferase